MPRVGYARGPIARSLALLLALGVRFVLVLPTAAADQSATSNTDTAWSPTVTSDGTAAWLKLTTGEWLKGSVDRIQDETVYFDSDQFDDIQIDWDDVAELRIPGPHTYRFTDRRILLGSGEVNGDVILVRAGGEVHRFHRKEFVSMIRGDGRELDYWSLNASLGFSGQAGNTKQLSFNSSLNLRRQTALTRSTLSYTGNVATQSGAVSADNHRASVAFDVYMTRAFYLVVPSVEVFQDQFQNIQLRLTPGLGLGYHVVWTNLIDWEIGTSMGYQTTRYISVESGSRNANDVAMQFNTDFDIDLPNRFDWSIGYQTQVVMTDVGKSNQNVSTTLSIDFWGPIDLDTTFQWNWVAKPVASTDGTLPTSSDFTIVFGFALDLQ
jgi:hypothetical protein